MTASVIHTNFVVKFEVNIKEAVWQIKNMSTSFACEEFKMIANSKIVFKLNQFI